MNDKTLVVERLGGEIYVYVEIAGGGMVTAKLGGKAEVKLCQGYRGPDQPPRSSRIIRNFNTSIPVRHSGP